MKELHAEGTYKGEIRHWLLGHTQNDTWFIQFNLVVTGQEFDGVVQELEERVFTVPVTLYLSPKALERSVTTLKWLGFADVDLRKLERSRKGAHNFAGKQVMLQCTHETYQGVDREKWQFDRRPSEACQAEKEAFFSKVGEQFGDEMGRALGQIPKEVSFGSIDEASDNPF